MMIKKYLAFLAIAFAGSIVILNLSGTGLAWVSKEDCGIQFYGPPYRSYEVSWCKGYSLNNDGTKTVFWCRPQFVHVKLKQRLEE